MNCKVENGVLVVDISVGFDCSRWGLTDLYPECEKNLRDLLQTGADFQTQWCSSKKELLSARYGRRNGYVWVEVNQWMDDLWEQGDLIFDALGGKDVEIDDDGIEYIRRVARELEIDDAVTVYEILETDSTFEDCMDAVTRLMEKSDAHLNEWYETLCRIVEDYVQSEAYINPHEMAMKIYKERG